MPFAINLLHESISEEERGVENFQNREQKKFGLRNRTALQNNFSKETNPINFIDDNT